MYRKNKFGENVDVEKYTCGSCENYSFEDERGKNKCSEYCSYYYYNDSCNKWEEARDAR